MRRFTNIFSDHVLRMVLAAIALYSVTFFAGRSAACPLCFGFPEKSVADWVMESPTVAFAREDPNKPFSLSAVEFLKGSSQDSQVDLFLDSVSRRKLAINPEWSAVIVRDKTGGTWRRIALAGPRLQSVVRRILVLAQKWQGDEGKGRRAEFFLPLFGHEDPTIYELAYLEMSRAPYPIIKRVSRLIEREHIDRILNRPEYIRWRSLAILMLANGGTKKDRQYVIESFRNAEKFQLSSNLAAWAAAAIEVEGVAAVKFVEEKYLASSGRTEKELKEILVALSLHGREGRLELRDRIVLAYGKLLDKHPKMSPDVAADLMAWNRTEWRDKLAKIRLDDSEMDVSTAQMIGTYIRKSAEETEKAKDE